MKDPTDHPVPSALSDATPTGLPRRLDKFVREATEMSLSQAREHIQSGKIQYRRLGHFGRCLDPAQLVYESDEVLFQSKRLKRRSTHQTYLLNKPKNVTTTAKDPRGKRDVSEWLAKMSRGTFPVGRLDRETTGALLFTTDGDLATAILRPEHQTLKVYWLWLNEFLPETDSRIDGFTKGVPMLGTRAAAEKVSVLFANEDQTELLVTLSEGKNRQLRRMCRALDLHLLHLHRLSVGPIEVGALPLGHFRALTGEEVSALWASVGGREAVMRKQLDALKHLARSRRENGVPDDYLEQWLAGFADWELSKQA